MKFKTREIILFISLMAIPLRDGFSMGLDEIITEADIFYSSSAQGKVKISTSKMFRSNSKFKWELEQPEIMVFGKSGLILEEKKYQKGFWKESLSTVMLVGNKSVNQKVNCLELPRILIFSRDKGILKSPSGFYLNLDKFSCFKN